MFLNRRLYQARWWLLALIVFLQITILSVSPEERTLGVGIKPVYLHVSLTWTGMVMIFITAVLGLMVLITGSSKLVGWQRSFLLSSMLFYGIGFLISMYASWINWGGIPIQEPRIQGAINVLVAAIAVWVLRELVTIPRIQGVVGLVPSAYMFLAGISSRMVLHPDNPVVTSPLSIRMTFLFMFALAILLSIWFLWVQRQTQNQSSIEH